MMLRNVLTAVIILSNATPASAVCYLCNRSDWAEQSSPTKQGFVMGAIAEQMQLFADEDEINKYRTDLASCVVDLGLDTDDLIDVVDNQYQVLDRWEFPPQAVLSMGLRSVCLSHMNRARKARGDDMLEP